MNLSEISEIVKFHKVDSTSKVHSSEFLNVLKKYRHLEVISMIYKFTDLYLRKKTSGVKNR